MKPDDDEGEWWSYILVSALLELPGTVVTAVACGTAVWLVLTFFPPR